MTPERFSTLIEAYGGRPERWPAAERDAACAFLAAHPWAQEACAREEHLDATLVAWTVSGPGAALAGRIAQLPAAGRRRLHVWWSGIGAAAALATGLAAGIAAVDAFAPPEHATSLYGLSVLGAPLALDGQDAPGST